MPRPLRAIVYATFWVWLVDAVLFWSGVSSTDYQRANAWRRMTAWRHEAESALIAFVHNPFDPVWAGLTMATRAALALLGWAVTHPAEALGAATVIAAIGFLIAVLRELRRVVIVEPFEVPECAERLGYTGAVLARRLILEAEERARGAGLAGDGPSMNLGGETPDLELPGSRLSVQSAARFLREALIDVTLLRVLIGIKPEHVVRGHVLRDGGGEARTLPSGRRGTASPPLYRLRLHLPSEHVAAPLSDAHSLIDLAKAAAPDLLALINPGAEMARAAQAGDDVRAEALAADLRARARRAPKWRRRAADDQIASCNLLRAAFARDAADRKEALANAAHNLRRHDWSASAHANRGAALAILGYHEEALAAYDRALAIDSNQAVAHSNRGAALGASKRHKKALAARDRALAIDTNHASTHNNRGNALFELQRYDDALAAYDRALAIDPKNADAHTNLGATLGELGDHEESLASIDRALVIGPTNSEMHYNRGNALSALECYEEALAAYDRALAIDPNHTKAHTNRGATLSALGCHEEALAAIGRALAIGPNRANAHANRRAALHALGRVEEA